MNKPGNSYPLWNPQTAAHRTLAVTLAGAVLLFCALPPVGWSLLGWVALIPWLMLIAVDEFQTTRPWLKIWLGGAVFWAAEIYYVPIPHWLLWFGWALLFLYLSVYPLLFVWIGRILVRDHRIPLVIAAPVVFTALEWIRAHLISGFGVSMLSGSQFRWPVVIQISDVAGAYGLTGLMVMVNVGLWYLISDRRRHWRSVLVGALALLVIGGYGVWRTSQLASRVELAETAGDTLAVAVVQGSIDTRFPTTESEQDAYAREFFEEYLMLQRHWFEQRQRARFDRDGTFSPDVIIWPEGKYPIPDVLPGATKPGDKEIQTEFRLFHQMLFEGIAVTPPAMIVGTTSRDPLNDRIYNAALLLDENGRVRDRYFKIQRVIFGEYVPGQEWFPVLDRMTPIGKGLSAGDQPASFDVSGYRVAPNICFEGAITHLVRDCVNELAALDREPDILVNITDDGWFYGTAALDHHLACNVMRAVENRKPVVVAANTGFSALIDARGVIRQQGPRRDTAVLEMQVPVFETRSLYRTLGDWPAALLTIICVIGIVTRRRGRGWRQRQAGAPDG